MEGIVSVQVRLQTLVSVEMVEMEVESVEVFGGDPVVRAWQNGIEGEKDIEDDI